MARLMLDKVNEIINRYISKAGLVLRDSQSILTALQPVFILLIITIMAYEAVSVIYKLVSFPLINPPPVKVVAQRQDYSNNSQRKPLPAYGIITERNLFLTTMKTAGDKQLDGGFFGQGAEISTFELKGTVAGDTAFGFAVMEERGKNKQILCRLGDMVGSAKLIKITRNTAILRSGDRDITLRIKETAQGSLFPPSPGGANYPATTGMTLSRSEITEKLGDLKTILSQAVVRPFFVAGTQDGYIISDIKPESLYQKLGLQNGDIILDVNSRRVQSADDILKLVNLMQQGASISLGLKRSGKTETINYSFQ